MMKACLAAALLVVSGAANAEVLPQVDLSPGPIIVGNGIRCVGTNSICIGLGNIAAVIKRDGTFDYVNCDEVRREAGLSPEWQEKERPGSGAVIVLAKLLLQICQPMTVFVPSRTIPAMRGDLDCNYVTIDGDVKLDCMIVK